jgi:hypothetical protein
VPHRVRSGRAGDAVVDLVAAAGRQLTDDTGAPLPPAREGLPAADARVDVAAGCAVADLLDRLPAAGRRPVSFVVHAAEQLLAASPSPSPQPGATAVTRDAAAAAAGIVRVGDPGGWIGPLIIGAAAGFLDHSAVGPHAMRDRVAVIGYYACGISFSYLLGFAEWEQGLTDPNWRMAWAVVSLVTHGALLLAMFGQYFGWTQKLQAWAAKRLQFAGTKSAAIGINGTLLGWTLAAVGTAPLSGHGGWGAVVEEIAYGCTSIWGVILAALETWLGGLK